jgi:hypothetical protein
MHMHFNHVWSNTSRIAIIHKLKLAPRELGKQGVEKNLSA